MIKLSNTLLKIYYKKGTPKLNGEKWIRKSKVLNRSFHADVFISKTKPKGIVLWLGGSGMDENKYNSRGKTVPTIFENTWNRLGHDLPIIFIFVTVCKQWK